MLCCHVINQQKVMGIRKRRKEKGRHRKKKRKKERNIDEKGW